jgi:D-glycero-D-manno-heptose 1,7-bisphosphate phosphatase
MKRPAVFIDRDGTMNEQMGYINHPSRLVILPGVPEAVRLLNQSGFLAIVVSNQSGVARGYFPMELVHKVNSLMLESLEREGARLDGIYFCPHLPISELKEYAVDCDCRKPKTGLIERACKDFEINLTRSFTVGDRYHDVEFGHRAGIRGILVRTGYGRGEVDYVLPGKPRPPDFIADDLLSAVHWILDTERLDAHQ